MLLLYKSVIAAGYGCITVFNFKLRSSIVGLLYIIEVDFMLMVSTVRFVLEF